MHTHVRTAPVCALLLFAGLQTVQASTLIAHYRLGEADPGAVNSLPGNNTTTDSSGNGFHLTKNGTASYTSDAAPGSTLAMDVTGGYYSHGSALTAAADNYLLQAWARPTSLDQTVQMVAYNGDGSFNGFGFHQFGDAWVVLFGGNHWQAFGGTVAVNQWTRLTLVRDGGVNTFYINDTAYSVASLPNAAAGDFTIGGGFAGSIDNVRLLTFTAGTLTANDLTGVPEPATLGLTGVALLTAVFFRRRSVN